MIVLFSQCTLLKLETEQEPLTNYEINTRNLLYRAGNQLVLNFNDACDSLQDQTTDVIVKQQVLILKLNFIRGVEEVVYQNPPLYAFVDTWIFLEQVGRYIESEEFKTISKDSTNILSNCVNQMRQNFDEFAKETLHKSKYNDSYEFVMQYVQDHPITNLDFVRTTPLQDYNEFNQIPDTAFIVTTGTLPQVMSELNSQLQFKSSALSSQLKWETQLIAINAGVDSVNVQATLDSISIKIDRFNKLVEQSPERFQQGLNQLIEETSPLLIQLNQQWSYSLKVLHNERVALDSMILRERAALDSIVQRERAVAFKEMNKLGVEVTKTAIQQLKDMISSILIYLILLFVVILVVPFTMGFYSGKWATYHKQKRDNKP
ncbi:hypothetical protein OAT16_05230 [Prolixibacteraceae bacterium]|nr:hypothetical protein [Prolixibacteraceae bacterium]